MLINYSYCSMTSPYCFSLCKYFGFCPLLWVTHSVCLQSGFCEAKCKSKVKGTGRSWDLIYLWLPWVFVAAHGLSLVAAKGSYSSWGCAGFSLWWLLLLQSMGSRRAGSVVVGHGMWNLPGPGLEPRVPCIGRWILNHWTTREVWEVEIWIGWGETSSFETEGKGWGRYFCR